IQSDMNTPVGNTTPPPSPPQNTAAPTISGTPQQGQVLTANEGSWTDTPTFAYHWRRRDSAGANCTEIAGATAKTYSVAAADVGATLRVVPYTTLFRSTQSDMNTPVGNTTPPPSPPQNTAAPTISGTPQQGQVLTANEGSWTDTPTFA